MKVKNHKTVTTDTVIEVSHEDIINALNASGDYNIPYNARIWVDCEKRQEFNLNNGGYINIRYKLTEDVPEEINEPIPF